MTSAVSRGEPHHNAKAFARRLAGGGPRRGIVAIVRSGPVPAAIIAGEPTLPVIDTICIAS